MNYKVQQNSLNGLTYMMRHLRGELQGHKVIVLTDHKPLVTFMTIWQDKQILRNWFSSIYFLYTCFLYSSFSGFYWVISRHVFWPLLAATLFGYVWIRKDYIGISLVGFRCSFLIIFLNYYLSYSYIILG